MSDDTENHTIKLLQEMRTEMRDIRSEIGTLRHEMHEEFDEVNTQIRGVTHMLTLVAAHGSTMDDRVTALEDRVLVE